ncbi:MAG: hypothetical protein LLG05_12600 [Porphyromonadaceae bacterium]|nr:hypothetical protein [Porphyromonadaceae bacterium]
MFQGGVVMGGVGMWTGLEKASGNVLNTGMKLMEINQQQRHQDALEQDRVMGRQIEQERMRIQNDENDRKQKLFQMEMEQRQKNVELIDIDDSLGKMGITSPEELNVFKKRFPLDIERIGDRDYIQRGKGTAHFGTFMKDPNFMVEFGTAKLGTINKNISAIDAQMQEGKLKPEQAQQLQQQREELISARTAAANGIRAAQMQLKNYGADERSDIAERRLALEERRVKALEDKTYNPNGAKENTAEQKKVDSSVRAIEGRIRVYDDEIKKQEKWLEANPKASKENIQKAQSNIEELNSRKKTSYNTIDQLKNGDIAVGDIDWSGGGKKQGGYNTPEDVRAAWKSGKITEAQAVKILQTQFKMK